MYLHIYLRNKKIYSKKSPSPGKGDQRLAGPVPEDVHGQGGP